MEKTKELKSTITNRPIMNVKYQIQRISCGGCVTRVKKVLAAHKNIEEVKIFIKPLGVAKINMSKKNLGSMNYRSNLINLKGIKSIKHFKSYV